MSLPLFTRHQLKLAPRCSLMPKGRPRLSAAAFHSARISRFGPTFTLFIRLMADP